jgi:hypothetical protein
MKMLDLPCYYPIITLLNVVIICKVHQMIVAT